MMAVVAAVAMGAVVEAGRMVGESKVVSCAFSFGIPFGGSGLTD